MNNRVKSNENDIMKNEFNKLSWTEGWDNQDYFNVGWKACNEHHGKKDKDKDEELIDRALFNSLSNEDFTSFEDENKKAFDIFIKSEEGSHCFHLTYSEDAAEIGFLAGCEFKDNKYSSLSANQCIHPEALDVEEGIDGVVCRKHLRILELEAKIRELKDRIMSNN